MEERICERCGAPRPPRARKWCAECRRALKLERKRLYNKSPRGREVYRQWFKDNPGKKREYRLKYQEYEREYQRTYRAATADHIRERNAEWRAAHPEYGKNWREANPERTYEYQRRGGPKRRAAKLKLPTESIAPAEIFERDGWRCQLCGERVQKTKKYPDIMSPSLDHIVPLSLGGHHVRANVQLAHLFCNISKRERAKGEQLRLIG